MEKYYPDDFKQETVEKISSEVVSYITEQIESAINEEQQKSMKTIEERAKLASEGYDDDGYSAGLYMGYVVGATEQKAIDEEVRLKKCDDMTEAEYNRETAFAEWYRKNENGTPTFSDAIEWARKEVIEKACEWLGNYLMEIGYPDDWLRDSLNIKSGKERFRKAMEE